MAAFGISGNGDRSSGSYSPCAADDTVSSAGIFLSGQRIREVSQVVYRDKTVQAASGEFCQKSCYDAEDKVKSADSSVMYAYSGVSGHAKCIWQSIYYFSDFFQVYIFLYEDTHDSGRTDGSAGNGRVRNRYITEGTVR